MRYLLTCFYKLVKGLMTRVLIFFNNPAPCKWTNPTASAIVSYAKKICTQYKLIKLIKINLNLSRNYNH